MAYATDQQAIHDGEIIYGKGNVTAVCRGDSFIYWPVKGPHATPIKSYTTDSIPVETKPVVTDSSMEELAWFVLNSINKRYARANDNAEQENAANGIDEENDDVYKEQTFSGKTYQDQINAVRQHHLATHRKNIESAKRQTEAARSRFNRK